MYLLYLKNVFEKVLEHYRMNLVHFRSKKACISIGKEESKILFLKSSQPNGLELSEVKFLFLIFHSFYASKYDIWGPYSPLQDYRWYEPNSAGLSKSLCKYSARLTSSILIDLSYFDRSRRVRKLRHRGHLSFNGTLIFNPKTSESHTVL